MLGVEGVAEEHLRGEGTGRALSDQQLHVAAGPARYAWDDRLHQIVALTSDGLNLAGIRKILELQG